MQFGKDLGKAKKIFKIFEDLYADNKIQEAFEACKEAAELGYIEAQRCMADIFYIAGCRDKMTGEIVIPQDGEKAKYWLKQAVEQGDEESILAYAHACDGQGVGKFEPDEAMKWSRKAIELGMYQGYRDLGNCYYTMGEHLKAFQAYECGVEKNDPQSMKRLAECYEKGIGCKADSDKAQKLRNMLCGNNENLWANGKLDTTAKTHAGLQEEINTIFPTGDAKRALNQIMNYVERTPKGAKIQINIILNTNSKLEVDLFVNFLAHIIYFGREYYSSLDPKVPATEFLMGNADKLNELYKGRDIKALSTTRYDNVVIYDFDAINTMKESHHRPSMVNRLFWNIRKTPNNFNVISGDKKVLASLLGKDRYSVFNYEVDFENWDADRVFTEVLRLLDIADGLKGDGKTGEFENSLKDYINEYYDKSILTNREYAYCLAKCIKQNRQDSDNYAETWSQDLFPMQITAGSGHASALSHIDQLVGLHAFKKQIGDLSAFLEFNNKVGNIIDKGNFNMHMIFTGNPGTGKTMCARMVTELFYNMGYIKQNKFTEVEGKDLIGEYLGQTAPKTDQVIKGALDGVLFIDEAYSTAGHVGSTTGVSYSQDFISTLLKSMEDYRDRIIIIFGGYKDEMDGFMKSNPGLQSRIGYNINFEDYTIDELYEILNGKFAEMGFNVESDVADKAIDVIKKASAIKNFGNARFIMNFLQYILIAHARNVHSSDDKSVLRTITSADINEEILEKLGNEKHLGFEG